MIKVVEALRACVNAMLLEKYDSSCYSSRYNKALYNKALSEAESILTVIDNITLVSTGKASWVAVSDGIERAYHAVLPELTNFEEYSGSRVEEDKAELCISIIDAKTGMAPVCPHGYIYRWQNLRIDPNDYAYFTKERM